MARWTERRHSSSPFFAVAWLSLIAIVVLAPDTYDEVLKLPPGVPLVSCAALSALIAMVVPGILRRWRRIFWLLLVANLAGVPRVAISTLELLGMLPITGPIWYVELLRHSAPFIGRPFERSGASALKTLAWTHWTRFAEPRSGPRS